MRSTADEGAVEGAALVLNAREGKCMIMLTFFLLPQCLIHTLHLTSEITWLQLLSYSWSWPLSRVVLLKSANRESNEVKCLNKDQAKQEM